MYKRIQRSLALFVPFCVLRVKGQMVTWTCQSTLFTISEHQQIKWFLYILSDTLLLSKYGTDGSGSYSLACVSWIFNVWSWSSLILAEYGEMMQWNKYYGFILLKYVLDASLFSTPYSTKSFIIVFILVVSHDWPVMLMELYGPSQR